MTQELAQRGDAEWGKRVVDILQNAADLREATSSMRQAFGVSTEVIPADAGAVSAAAAEGSLDLETAAAKIASSLKAGACSEQDQGSKDKNSRK